MKILLSIVGALFILTGLIWFFQGTNLLPGSFMTGQIRWAVYGVLALAFGAGILIATWRARRGGS